MTQPTYRMSTSLKDLLRRFGEVDATTSFYASIALPGPVEYPGEHYPHHDLEPGEPALIVKVARDGEFRMSPAGGPDGSFDPAVRVMELPEDEFWYFEAFRPALSRLSLGAPAFLFEMALVNLYGVFEAYLADVVRDHLGRRPDLMGDKAKRALAGDGQPQRAMSEVLDQEVRRVTFSSISVLLGYLRSELGLVGLTEEHDRAIQSVALVRNCLLHAGGRVDQRLAEADPAYAFGARIAVGATEFKRWGKELRALAYAIDRARVSAPAA